MAPLTQDAVFASVRLLTKTRRAAYYFITWQVWLHRCMDGGEDRFALGWPSPFNSIPRVVPGAARPNGATKKTQ